MKNNVEPHTDDRLIGNFKTQSSFTRGSKGLVLALSILFSFSIFSSAANANPTGGQVSAGQATISSPNSHTVQINQTSDKAVIDWRSFNISQHEATRFNQPSSSSITLNRVDPANGSSTIAGSLSANGRVWLINPAGIFFSSTARVDVAGLVATTANITNADFMSGQYHFVQSPDWNAGIVNEGTITVRDKGLVALVAPGVENRGVIQANLGSVALASGREFTVDFYGDQLISFGVNAEVNKVATDPHTNQPMRDAVGNSGKIIANGGKVLLTAKTAEGILDNTINMSGHIIAKSAVQKNGVIILSGGNHGVVKVSGKLIASGKKHGQTGGVIKILGNKVAVTDKAEIIASGNKGGGKVLIGGNAHGGGPEQNADYTYVGPNAVINASALQYGDGGTVIAWSDKGTQFYGTILATGGLNGGNGGFAETSGGYLDVAGIRVNLSAPLGNTGTWLLDPADLTISGGATANPAPFTNPYTADNNSNTSTVNVTDLTNALDVTGGGANVVVQTTSGGTGTGSGNITVATPITWTTAHSLTLKSINNIIINASSAITMSAVGSSLILDMAGSAGTQASIIAGSGSLVKQGVGTFTLSQANTYTGGTTVSGGTLSASVLVAAGSQVGTGGITINNGATFSYTGATATAPAARTFTIGTGGGTIQVLRDSPATASTLTISGGISIGANTLTIDTSGTAPANITIATNPITNGNTDGGSLIKTGLNTLTISIASTYGTSAVPGTTTINNGILSNGATNALPTTTALTVGGSGTYNMNNFAQTIGSLSGSGIVRNTGGTSRVLTVGDSTSTTFSGTLGNTSGFNFGITKQGSGTLTLSGVSLLGGYTGATIISAGTLKTGIANALSNTSAYTVTSTLDLNGFAQSIGSLAGAGTVNLSAALTTGSSTNNTSTTFSGLLNGSSNLIKEGTGTLTLSGTVAGYTGTTNINAGGITVNTNVNALGTGTVNIAPTSATASTLTVTALPIVNNINLDSTNAAATLSGTGTQTYSGLVSLTGTGNIFTNPSSTITLNNIVSGTGGFTKAGAGTWALTNNNNSYSGKTSVSAGVLNFSSIANVGGGNSALGAPTTIANGTIDLTGTLTYVTGTGHSTDRIINLTGTGTLTGSSTGTLTLNGDITGSSPLILTGTGAGTIGVLNGKINTGNTLTKNGTGIWILAGDNASASTPYTTTNITAGTLQIGNADISGTLGTGAVTDAATLIFNRTDNITVNNAISGTGAVTLNGSGTVTLGSTSNTYSGTTTLNAGTLKAGAANTFSPNTAFTFGTVTSNTLDLNDFNNTVKSLAGGIGFGEVKLGNVTGGTITIQNTASTNYGGIISGLGGVTINATGFVQTLAGSNTFTGATLVNAGTLTLNNVNALGSSSNQSSSITVNSGATLTTNFAGTLGNNTAVITLNGAGVGGNGNLTSTTTGGIISNAITLAADATIGGANSLTLSGIISGTGFALTKTGANTITLSNSNTYSGGTTINTGTLSVTNTNGLGASGAIAINNAAILSLNLGGNTLANSSAITLAGTTAAITGANAAATNDTLNNAISLTGTDNRLNSTTTNATLTLAGLISGSSGFTKAGTGILAITNANTGYTGNTSATAGTLSITNANALGGASGGTISLSAATLSLNLGGATLANTNSLSLTGAAAITGTLASGTDTLSNAITVVSGSPTITSTTAAATLALSGGITHNGTTLTFTGAGDLSESGVISGAGALSKTGNGTFTLSNANNYTGASTVSAGTLAISNASALGDIASGTTISGTGTLQLTNIALNNEPLSLSNGGTITGTGTSSIPTTINLSGTTATRTISAPSVSDSLTLSNALNNAVALTLGGAGTITLSSVIGDGTPLTSLIANAALVLNNGNITTTGTQTYNNAVTLGANTTLNSTASLISFALSGSTINNSTARNLTINTNGIGGITLVGNVGTGVNPLGTIALNTTGTTTITGTVNAASLATDAGAGGTTLNGSSITTSGNQTFNDAVTLALVGKNLTSNGGAINFNSTLTGAFALTILANTGVTFGGAVTALSSLDVTGATAINANITSVGAQSYHSAITLGAPTVTLTTTNTAVTADSTIISDGTARNLTISTGNGAINLSGNVGAGGAGNVLGTLTLNTTGIGTISGTVNAGSLITNASGTTNINGGAITTSGTQTYGDAAVLGANTTLSTTDSIITFSSTLDRDAGAARTLTTSSGTGGVTFTGNVGAGANGALGAIQLNTSGTSTITGTLAADTLTTDAGGTTALNGTTVTTTGASGQVYGDVVTLNNAATVLNAGTGAVTFSNTLDSLTTTARPLTINTSGTTTFSGAVGATNPLSTLTTDAAGSAAINGGSIRTSGTQTFNDAVSLGQDTTFTITATANILLPNVLNSFTFTPTFVASAGTITTLSLSNASASAVFPVLSSTPTNLTLNFSGKALSLPSLTLAGTLNVTAGGNITQNNGTSLVITGVTTVAAGANDISLDNSGNNFSTLSVTNGNNVLIRDLNGITLGASTISGAYGVTTAGAIIQSGILAVTGTSTFDSGSTANSITLNTFTNDFGTVIITRGNNVAFLDGNNIDLGTSTISGTLGVTTSGNITQSGAVSITGASTLASGTGNIALDSFSNDFVGAVGITSANNVALKDTNIISLGTSNVSGTYDVTAGGTISQSGVTTLAITGTPTFTVTAASSDILLGNANAFSTTPVFTNNGNIRDITLRRTLAGATVPILPTGLRNLTLTFNNAAMALPAMTLTGNLSATTGGISTPITQTGALNIAGTTTLVAGAANDITLSNTANSFTGAVAVTSGNNVSISDAGALLLGASTISGTFDVTAAGTISQNGVLTVTGTPTFTVTAPTSNIALSTSANVFNTTPVFTNNGNIQDLLLRNTAATAATPVLPNDLRNLTLTFNNSAITLPALTLTGTLTTTSLSGLTINGNVSTGGAVTSTITAGNFSVVDGAILSTSNAAIALTATDFDLNTTGALSSGTAATTITQNTSGGSIGLGNTAGSMTISGSELQRMTTGAFALNAPSNGQIIVDGITAENSANIAGTTTLTATTGTTGSISLINNSSTFNRLTLVADTLLTVGDNVTVSTNNNPLAITALDIDLNTTGALNAGTSSLTINDSVTGATAIELGHVTGTVGSMGISNSELQRMTANTLSISTGSNATQINVDGVTEADMQNIAGTVTLTATAGTTNFINFINNSSSFAHALTMSVDNDLTIADGVTVSTNNAALSITAQDLNLNSTGALNSGTGNITITQNATGAGIIELGNPTGTPGVMGISGSELQRISGNNLTISAASNGEIFVDGITLANTANIAGLTTLNTTTGTSGAITFQNNSSAFTNALTISADDRLIVNDGVTLSTNNAAVSINALSINLNSTGEINIGNATLSITQNSTGSGIIELGNVTGTPGRMAISGSELQRMTAGDLNLTAASNGQIIVDGVTAANTANISGTTTLSTTAGTTGSVSFDNNSSTFTNALTIISDQSVILTDGITLSTTNSPLSITAFDLNLNSSSSLNAGTSDITITQNTTGGTIGLGTTAGTMTISGPELQRILANNLNINAASNGQIIVDGISAANSANINNTVTLTATTGTLGNVIFQNNPSSFRTLSVNTDDGIAVNSALTTTIGDLNMNGDVGGVGAITLNNNLTAAGSIILAASSGGINVSAPVVLSGNDVTLNSATNGTGSLTINPGSGSAIFNSVVGNNTSLGSLTVNGPTTINTSAITTSGNQNYNGALTLGASSVFTSDSSGNINFGTVDGAFNLTVNTAGATTFGGAIGSTTALNNLTTDSAGSTFINGGSLNANTAITLNDAVTLGADTTFTMNDGNVTFDSTVDSDTSAARNLTITLGAGNLTMNGALGSINALAAFTASNTGATRNITITNNINTTNDITLTAGNNINLDAGSLISSLGNIILNAIDGIIQELGSGYISGNTLTTTTLSGVNLAAANAISIFNANNAGGDITLNNIASLLTISGVAQSGGGNADVFITNTGALTNSGVITTGGGDVSLTTLSPDSSARTLTIGADVTTSGGAFTANAANPNNISNALVVNAVVNTTGGTGQGTLTVGGGVEFNVAPVLGSGDITFQGNGLDLTLGTLNFNDSIGFAVNRYLIINGALTGSSNITLTGDASNTGVGGVYITSLGSVNSGGDLTISGSSLAGLSGADSSAGIQIDSGAFVSAAGNISLLGNIGNGNILVNTAIQSSGAGTIIMQAAGTGEIQLGADVTSNGGAISFYSPTTLTTNVSLNSGGGDLTFSSLSGGKNLSLDSGSTGNITFNGNANLAGLTISNTHDLTNNATLYLTSYQQNAGNNTFLGTHTLNVSGNASIKSNNVTGNIVSTGNVTVIANTYSGTVNVGGLALSISQSLSISGTIGGASGAAAIAKIVFITPIPPNAFFGPVNLNAIPSNLGLINSQNLLPPASNEENLSNGNLFAAPSIQIIENAVTNSVPAGVATAAAATYSNIIPYSRFSSVLASVPGFASSEGAVAAGTGSRLIGLARAGLAALPQELPGMLVRGISGSILLISAMLGLLINTFSRTILRRTFITKAEMQKLSFTLRTHLNNILGFADLAYNEKLCPTSVTQKEFIADILAGSAEMSTYLSTKVEDGRQLPVAKLSFEIRTMLDGVIGFAKLINDGKTGAVSPELKEYLGYIISSAQTILTVVQDVTDRSQATFKEATFANMMSVSFKLRTSLNNISGFADLILNDKNTPITAEQKESISDILSNSKELQHYLIKEIEAGKTLPVELLKKIAFQLRTSLENMAGFTELMYTEKLGPVAKDHKEYLSYIISSTEDISRLLNDINNQIELESHEVVKSPIVDIY